MAVCVYVCVRACMRACVHACVRACVCVCVCTHKCCPTAMVPGIVPCCYLGGIDVIFYTMYLWWYMTTCTVLWAQRDLEMTVI